MCIRDSPNIRYTTDGNARPYEHGGKQYVVASMSFVENPFEFEQSNFEMAFEILSDEEIQTIFQITKEELYHEYISVSYTHLDVYKRQCYPFPGYTSPKKRLRKASFRQLLHNT